MTALARQPTLVRSAPPGGGFLETLNVSPDGRWIASSDDQNQMHLYDATTNRLVDSYDAGRPPEGEQAFMFAAFSPDSRQLAVLPEGRANEPVRLLDPHTMEPTTELAFPGAEPVVGIDVEFSANGRYLAATAQSSTGRSRTPTSPRATRWSGTFAPRPRPRRGCRPGPTSRGWRSARTVGPCTPVRR